MVLLFVASAEVYAEQVNFLKAEQDGRAQTRAGRKDYRLVLEFVNLGPLRIDRRTRAQYQRRKVLLGAWAVIEITELVPGKIGARIGQHLELVFVKTERDRQQWQLFDEIFVALVEQQRGIMPKDIGAIEQTEPGTLQGPMDLRRHDT